MSRVASISLIVIVGMTIGSWGAAGWVPCRAGNSCADSHHAGPVAVLPTTHRDLGMVRENAPLVARFEVRNDGNRRLVIRRQNAGCCGEAESNQVLIVPPGCSAELVTMVEVGVHSGRVEKSVAYATNDPARPQFALVLSADIRHSRP